MICIQRDVLILVVTIIAACSGEEHCEPKSPVRFVQSADKFESIALGSIRESSLVVDDSAPASCEDPASLLFRTFDGTCNHPKNLGVSSTPSTRVLDAEYGGDGNSPRQRGTDDQPLPSARLVSTTIHPDQNVPENFTIMKMQWGQWIDHDLVLTPVTSVPNGNLNCCGPDGGCPPMVTNIDCFPVEVPKNDSVMPGTCMNFVRSTAAVDPNTKKRLNPREQINKATAFLDCSQVYGSSDDVASTLREPDSFLMRTKNNGSFPPEAPNQRNCQRPNVTTDYCFLTGDGRGNQHTYLAAMHTLFIREHNRVARKIKAVRPSATNEEVFQTARKIIIAYNQIITYNHYLPLILGRDATTWNLISTSGRSFYNQAEDPRMFSGFTTAAFRFGHSTISTVFPIGNELFRLSQLFFRPGFVVDSITDVFSGMFGLTNITEKSSQTADRFVSKEVSQFLFFNRNTGRGSDLITFNIQRGRDHGLPPYNKWRKFCLLPRINSFSDMGGVGSQFEKIYRSVDDIDLFPGMLSENIDVGTVGPTIRCLLRIQFFRTKFGDRFFYDNNQPNVGFTDAQLSALRRVTLSKLLCWNTDMEKVQTDAFRFPSSSNPMVNCSRLRSDDINWNLFR